VTIKDFALTEVSIDGIDVLALRDLRDEKMSPLFVDFASGALTYRRKHGFGKGQALGRAIGLKSGVANLKVVDATAGLGTDAFMMAALGCSVHAIERSGVVFALLEDGFKRLRALAEKSQDPELNELVSRMKFTHGDAASVMESLAESPDVVYVDPMYPDETHSSALPKKSMQMFRRLLDGDQDADKILEVARRIAKRVVVKRPLKAPPLAAKSRQSIEGKTIRYDIYLSQ
jgi:16S rRNA (guanine1516-N2)-methyltransferase